MPNRVRCLSCGHRIELTDTYDDYEGLLRCWACGALMSVTMREGRLRAMDLKGATPRPEPCDVE